MKNAANVVIRMAGIAWLVQLVLGVLFWTGHARSLTQLHMLIGMVFVVCLWVLGVLGIRARAPMRNVLPTLVWSLLVPALGVTQMQIFPGAGHWVVRVVHVLFGMAAMGSAQSLTRAILGSSGRAPGSPWVGPDPAAARVARLRPLDR